MPMPAPHTLPATDVYALTANVLNLNDIVGSDFVVDRDSLPKVKMPNHDAFTWIDPRPDPKSMPCTKALIDPGAVKTPPTPPTAEGYNLTPRTTGPLDTMPSR